MTWTNFPNGATSLGIPLVGPGSGYPISIPGRNSSQRSGQVLFVNAEAGGGNGTSPDSALATIAGALTRVNSGAGDTIYVAPGSYDEDVVVTQDYVAIIGMIYAGYAKPDIGGVGTPLTVTGQGFMGRHLRFTSDDSDVVVQNGNGFLYDDCVFDGSSGLAATEGCLRLVPHATDDGLTASEGFVLNSYFRGNTSGAGIIFQHGLATGSGVGVSDNVIAGCRFVGNGVDLLSAVNTSGGGTGIFTSLTIAGNYFLTGGAAYVYGDMDAGAAGDLTANQALICGNWFNDDAFVAAQFDISGQSLVCFVGNYDAAGLINGSTFND